MKKIISILFISVFMTHSLVHAGCVSQLREFLAQFKRKPFEIIEWGEVRLNHHTHTHSIIEDLVVEIKDEAQIKSLSHAVFPHGRKRRKALRAKLKEELALGHKKVSLRLVGSETMQQLTNTTPRCDGPNCFNATVKYFYPDKELDETHFVELDNYLRTHFKPVKAGKDLQFGDVIVWRTPQGEPVHSAIYINETYCWHKATYNQNTSWVFEKTMAINMMYGIDSKNYAKLEAFRHKPPSWLQ